VYAFLLLVSTRAVDDSDTVAELLIQHPSGALTFRSFSRDRVSKGVFDHEDHENH
jgi:hypothetical protein